VPVYQQLTQLVDEQMVNGALGAFEGLNATQAIAVSRALIDASQAGDYAALMTQFHNDYYEFTDPRLWAEGTVDYARSQGVPIWNADQWLSFTQTRHDANYTNIVWDAGSGVLRFDIAMAATAGVTPTTMLPLSYGGLPLQSVTVDGGPYTPSVQTIKSVNVAFVSIPAGNHSISAVYVASAYAHEHPNFRQQYAGQPPTFAATPANTPTSRRTPTATQARRSRFHQRRFWTTSIAAMAPSAATGRGLPRDTRLLPTNWTLAQAVLFSGVPRHMVLTRKYLSLYRISIKPVLNKT
jgi:hypothetical protein